jgi:hypothetical protein
VADSPRGPEAGLARGHLAQQLVGMQASLHQQLAPALPDQRDACRRRLVAMFGSDDLAVRDIDPVLGRHRGDPVLGPD